MRKVRVRILLSRLGAKLNGFSSPIRSGRLQVRILPRRLFLMYTIRLGAWKEPGCIAHPPDVELLSASQMILLIVKQRGGEYGLPVHRQGLVAPSALHAASDAQSE